MGGQLESHQRENAGHSYALSAGDNSITNRLGLCVQRKWSQQPLVWSQKCLPHQYVGTAGHPSRHPTFSALSSEPACAGEDCLVGLLATRGSTHCTLFFSLGKTIFPSAWMLWLTLGLCTIHKDVLCTQVENLLWPCVKSATWTRLFAQLGRSCKIFFMSGSCFPL